MRYAVCFWLLDCPFVLDVEGSVELVFFAVLLVSGMLTQTVLIHMMTKCND